MWKRPCKEQRRAEVSAAGRSGMRIRESLGRVGACRGYQAVLSDQIEPEKGEGGGGEARAEHEWRMLRGQR